MPDETRIAFEEKIKETNKAAGRGSVILRGDYTRYILDAIRLWIKEK
jgi:hypothetical protein